MTWSLLRRMVQVLVLAAFIAVTISGLTSSNPWLSANIFSRLDPLVGLATSLATRTAVTFWAASLLTVLLTLVFGRAWCGWLCPLGATLDLMPARGSVGRRWQARMPSRRWRYGKYATLAFVLTAAIIGDLGPMILDPVTIVLRPLQELARPLLGADALGQSIGASLAREFVSRVALLSILPLVLVLGLEMVQSRFWCRNLCPLGGLLGLIAKVPGVRRVVAHDACTSCSRCANICPTGAIDTGAGFVSDPSECVACLACSDACRTDANTFRLTLSDAPSADQSAAPAELSRRGALAAIGATGLGAIAAFTPLPEPGDVILRPPFTDERRLAERCVRCGACYSACPSGSLRPSVSFLSVAGPWTPMLDERPAHCTLNCNRCAEPCPTDAIHTPTPAEASTLGLGLKAEVDRDRCRAWAENRACMECTSGCPIAGALTGILRPGPTPDGRRPVLVPVVDPGLCVGCDLCAQACVERPQAIGAPLPEITGPTGPPAWMLELMRRKRESVQPQGE